MEAGTKKIVCPLTNAQLVDLIQQFISIYNEPAGIHIYSYQSIFMRRIVEAVLEQMGPEITGLWSRQSGKSESLACLSSALCIILPTLCRSFPDDPRLSQYSEGFWVGIFAPKQQQSGIIYDRIRSRAEKDSSKEIYSDPDIRLSVATSRGDQVSWTNGSFVTAQTASEQSNVEGKTYHLIIIDEAQMVSEGKIAKEIRPMMAATNGVMVKIGTANALRGNFKKSIQYNLEIEKQTGIRNHFEFPFDLVILEKKRTFDKTKNPFHLNYEKFITEELRRLGGNKENEEFKQNFRLLWQEANMTAIDHDALASAGNYDEEMIESCFNRRIVGGLDYGRKRDYTILTLAEVDPTPIVDLRSVSRPGDNSPTFYNKKIIAWYEIPGRKWYDILQQVVEALSRFAVDTLVADGTGIGDPLCEQLQQLIPSTKIIPFVMSHVGNDLVYKHYIQEIEAGRMRYVAGTKTRQTQVFEQFIYEHQELIKERLGVYTRFFAPENANDDFTDSGALCCYAASMPMHDEWVESVANPLYASRTDKNRTSRAERYRR